MIVIDKAPKDLLCCLCSNPATTSINGMNFCPDCSDSILIKIIGKCVKAVQKASISLKIFPKLSDVIQDKPCEHKHTHIENLTSGSICDNCGEEI
jgi:hypothetical protein